MRGWKWLVAAAMTLPLWDAAPVLAAPAAGEAEAGKAGGPSPEDRQQARTHANNGFQAFKAEKYAVAIEQFGAAEKLVHAPPHVLFMARSFAKLGRLVEARAQYQVVIGEALDEKAPPAFRTAQKDATTELAELEKRIPRIALELEACGGATPSVALDGTVLGQDGTAEALWVDPGAHTLRAEAEGCKPAETKVEVTEGQGTVAVKLALEPTGAPNGPVGVPGEEEPQEGEPFELPIGPTVLTAAGIAVLAVGGITGGLALDSASELRAACPQNPCPTENESLADDANLLATISTVSFIAGGLATAGGIAWLVVDLMGSDGADAAGEQPDAVALRVRPVVSLGFVGLAGVLP